MCTPHKHTHFIHCVYLHYAVKELKNVLRIFCSMMINIIFFFFSTQQRIAHYKCIRYRDKKPVFSDEKVKMSLGFLHAHTTLF